MIHRECRAPGSVVFVDPDEHLQVAARCSVAQISHTAEVASVLYEPLDDAELAVRDSRTDTVQWTFWSISLRVNHWSTSK